MNLKGIILFIPLLLKAQPAKVLSEWQNDPSLKFASYAFTVIDAGTGSVITEYNSKLPLIPASTQKIFTTAAALETKGLNYRFETLITYDGQFDTKNGVLTGNLYIQGSNDPSLQSRYFGKQNVTDTWAKAIVAAGIKKINGRIIGDAGTSDHEVPSTWLWEDVSNYFGTSLRALNYADNRFSIFFKSGPKGQKAEIVEMSPAYKCCSYSITVDVESEGTRDEAYVYGDPFSFQRRIRGSIPAQKERYEIEAALPDPALLCAEQLRASLVNAGVNCTAASARSNYELSAAIERKILYRHQSPELEKLVYYTNQNSNNLYCEAVATTLNEKLPGQKLLALKTSLKKFGIDTSEIFMKDACGLSRLNSCTTASQANLLYSIYNNKVTYAAFNASLPVSGKQGSMAGIGKGTFAENNLRAKTGYLERVRSYCGYVQTKSGKELAFSVIMNNYSCSAKEAKLKLEKFLVALTEL